MAVRHTIRRSTINAIAQQVMPEFKVGEEYKLFIETDGEFAHVKFASKGRCPECMRYEDKLAAEQAIRKIEGREEEE